MNSQYGDIHASKGHQLWFVPFTLRCTAWLGLPPRISLKDPLVLLLSVTSSVKPVALYFHQMLNPRKNL